MLCRYVYADSERDYPYEDWELYAGTASEIQALYNILDKNDELLPYYSDEPKFNPHRRYGVIVDYQINRFHVVSEATWKRIVKNVQLDMHKTVVAVYALRTDGRCLLGAYNDGHIGDAERNIIIAEHMHLLEENETGIIVIRKNGLYENVLFTHMKGGE